MEGICMVSRRLHRVNVLVCAELPPEHVAQEHGAQDPATLEVASHHPSAIVSAAGCNLSSLPGMPRPVREAELHRLDKEVVANCPASVISQGSASSQLLGSEANCAFRLWSRQICLDFKVCE